MDGLWTGWSCRNSMGAAEIAWEESREERDRRSGSGGRAVDGLEVQK